MLRDIFKKRHSRETLARVGAAFPEAFKNDVSVVMESLAIAEIEPHLDVEYRFIVKDTEVTIPARVYFPETRPSEFGHLTKTQLSLLAAIMTRHHSGYQRELWAEQLALYPSPSATPFLAMLLGDYVCEVVLAVERSLVPDWTPLFHEFSANNSSWLRPLNQRIISYWHTYYRHEFPRLRDYPTFKVTDRLGLWDKKVAPRLIRK